MVASSKEDYYNDQVLPPAGAAAASAASSVYDSRPATTQRPASPLYRSPTSNQPVCS